MTALLVLIVCAYLLATAAICAWVSDGDDGAQRSRYRFAAVVFGTLAVIGHVAIHALAWRASGGPDMHFFAALSLVTLGMAALTTAAAWRQQVQTLGVVVYPLAAMMAALYHFYGHFHPDPLEWQLQLHAWLALFAYATLSLAALLAIMLWFQERALRQRQIYGWLRALPPLTQLEQLLFQSIGVGFVLLTLVLVTGLMFVDNLLAQHLWHKTVLSVLSWLVFGWLLFGRWRYGWRGQRAVKFTLIAMALLLLAFFGSKFVLELVLKRM
ncbi:MAG: cytochrome c biogenesis protein CcsA [Lysobacteraceae bacterium]